MSVKIVSTASDTIFRLTVIYQEFILFSCNCSLENKQFRVDRRALQIQQGFSFPLSWYSATVCLQFLPQNLKWLLRLQLLHSYSHQQERGKTIPLPLRTFPISHIYHFQFHFTGKNSATWPCITAREARKCCLYSEWPLNINPTKIQESISKIKGKNRCQQSISLCHLPEIQMRSREVICSQVIKGGFLNEVKYELLL